MRDYPNPGIEKASQRLATHTIKEAKIKGFAPIKPRDVFRASRSKPKKLVDGSAPMRAEVQMSPKSSLTLELVGSSMGLDIMVASYIHELSSSDNYRMTLSIDLKNKKKAEIPAEVLAKLKKIDQGKVAASKAERILLDFGFVRSRLI